MSTILVATDTPLWKSGNGAAARMRALCAHMVKRGHAVHVYTTWPVKPADAAAAAELVPDVVLHHLGSEAPGPGGLLARAKEAIGLAAPTAPQQPKPRKPNQRLPEFRDPVHLEAFRRVVEEARPGVVIVHLVRLAYLLEVLPDGPERPRTVADTHDVMHERTRRFHAQGESHWIDIDEAEEAAALRRFDLVVAIQSRDAETFRRMMPGQPVIVAAHPAPIRPLPPHRGPVIRLGFIGAKNPPNRLAIERFLREVWPALHATHGESIRLDIAGPVCDALERPLPDGVEAVGFVPNLEDFYEACDILVNPVFMGGGLKIKCVEALCHGRPLVTTPVGAEGLEDGAEMAFACCPDSDAMYSTLDAWISDPALRERFARRALDYAQEHLSETAVFLDLDDWIEGGDARRGR